MWTMPVPSSSETSSQNDAVLDLRRARKIVEQAAVRATHELLAAHPLHEFGV